jgi:Putative capsular polysaccharide synthesis protein
MNEFPPNWFSRQLSRLYWKISPPDATRNYQKGLDRELSRVRKAFEGCDRIVLILTHGKVGSTTVHKAVRKLPGFQSFQNHFISEEGVSEALQQHREEHAPVHLLQGEAIRRALLAHPDRPIKLITLMRDPVARALSNLFQHPVVFNSNTDIRNLPIDTIMATAMEQILFSLDYTERWFDRELSALIGYDLFSRRFNGEDAFQRATQGRFELLAGKLEHLSGNGPGCLGRFLDIGCDLPIPISHARAATSEAAVYDQLKRSLKLPADLLDKVYSSRVCRHFYTPEELEGFRKYWIQSRLHSE